jgi:hypothetical protein
LTSNPVVLLSRLAPAFLHASDPSTGLVGRERKKKRERRARERERKKESKKIREQESERVRE